MSSDQTFVIIGAGQAGGWAAKTLRDQGFEGRVIIVGDEDFAPHERPPLSKEVLLGDAEKESCLLWPPGTLEDADIEMRLGLSVKSIDADSHTMSLANGETHAWNKLLIATGGRARSLDVDGVDLDGVYTLRTIEDAEGIRARLRHRRQGSDHHLPDRGQARPQGRHHGPGDGQGGIQDRRDRDGNRMTLAQAIKRQCHDTARLYGFEDRGVLAPGLLADLNVIDLESLQLNLPTVAFDLPAGGRRLLQTASGYDYTIKSGQVTFRGGVSTGKYPGRVIRGPQSAPVASSLPATATDSR